MRQAILLVVLFTGCVNRTPEDLAFPRMPPADPLPTTWTLPR